VLRLRHTNPALLNGNYAAINESDANVLSYLRIHEDNAVVVVLNMSGAPQTVMLDLKAHGFGSAKALLATPKSGAMGGKVSLAPYGAFIGELSK
jgi:glycosidase